MPLWLIAVCAVGVFGFCCTLMIGLGCAAKLGDEVLDRALRRERERCHGEGRLHRGAP